MSAQYVEQGDGGDWDAGTRVSLDSVLYPFMEGQTAANILQAFPMLSFDQPYGSIAFHRANRPAQDGLSGTIRERRRVPMVRRTIHEPLVLSEIGGRGTSMSIRFQSRIALAGTLRQVTR